MQEGINWSRIISILTFIASLLTFAAHYLGNVIPADYMTLIAGVAAAILAFTERITGGASKV